MIWNEKGDLISSDEFCEAGGLQLCVAVVSVEQKKARLKPKYTADVIVEFDQGIPDAIAWADKHDRTEPMSFAMIDLVRAGLKHLTPKMQELFGDKVGKEKENDN